MRDLSQKEIEDMQVYVSVQNQIHGETQLLRQSMREFANLQLKLTEMRQAAAQALKWKTETQCGNYEAWLRVQIEQSK